MATCGHACTHARWVCSAPRLRGARPRPARSAGADFVHCVGGRCAVPDAARAPHLAMAAIGDAIRTRDSERIRSILQLMVPCDCLQAGRAKRNCYLLSCGAQEGGLKKCSGCGEAWYCCKARGGGPRGRGAAGPRAGGGAAAAALLV